MKFVVAVVVSGLVGLAVALLIYLPEVGSDGDEAVPETLGTGGLTQALPRSSPAVDEIASSRRSAIVQAAERVGPAVVSITVIQTRVVTASPRSPFRDPLLEQFFRDFFGARRHVERVPSLGSGVIISGDGLIVTNEHVVRDGTEIKVTLTDSRQFDARLVASDQEYDLALLKIEADGLPHIELGDSDSLIIGEWAIALGNPFGYLLDDTHPTVTVGVISALHRNIRTGEDVTGVYKDMIQTDAAINPGNSGGPLVNSLGEVIGINTFIITNSGGSMGIGFAIPVNRAKFILTEVRQYGHIREIWIGLLVQEITPLIARSLGLQDTRGVIVSHVDEESPAAKAGFTRGDVIIEVNGEGIKDFDSARRAIFGSRVGDSMSFRVQREGAERALRLIVGEVPG
jgi:serine protease Do